ncbi:MAG: hypothetical protein JG768_1413 [Fusobacteriales bacterium]|nr:hypothetical protein [Fusobacteriales bacterium]
MEKKMLKEIRKVSILIFTGYLFFLAKELFIKEDRHSFQGLNPYFYWISILSYILYSE